MSKATKLHLKTGDKVLVIAGDDKGKTGVVKEVIREKNRAVVEGVNVVKKHIKKTKDSEGQIIEFSAGVHVSNLKVVDPKTDKPTRIGRKLVTSSNGKSKLTRYSKKTGEVIN